MIIKSKKPIKLYSSSSPNELIITKSFEEGTNFRYVNISSSYMGYYELHSYRIKVIDSNNEEFDIEAYRIQNTKEIFVKGILGTELRERTTWKEAFEGDCPIVV
tara:strand:+ start:1108 stop:1419 length:312 start_codon:yes stop_codon:yes gene_type:complete